MKTGIHPQYGPAMITCAFLIAYGIRWESTQLDPNIQLAPISQYFGLLVVQVFAIGIVMFWARLYHQARAVSRVDEFYSVFGAVSIGMMMSVAISTLLFKNLEFDFPRTLIIYSWVLTIMLVMVGRLFYHAVQWRVQVGNIKVFRRTGLPCPRCGAAVTRIVVGQRTSVSSSAPCSITTCERPWRAASSAHARPTGPAPTTRRSRGAVAVSMRRG